jgi:hypothetical protein
VLTLGSFGLGHATAARHPATSPAVVRLDPTAAVAAVSAFLATPEGQAALAREFAPGSFAQPAASSQPVEQCRPNRPC